MMNLPSMPSSDRAKSAVFWFFILSGITWCFLNFKTLSAGDDGVVRLIMGFVMACAVLFREKEQGVPFQAVEVRPLLIRALIGAVMHIMGLVFDVHQFQWLGFILLFSAGVSWSIDPIYVPDLNKGLFLFYWVHPLPGSLFGPIQIFLQKVSILGSEWILHCISFPVWADGMILRAGSGVFEVPAACSGMRTLVTVLMCVVGTAFIFRLSILPSIIFCVIGAFQVVALNILRISLMVRVSASAYHHVSPEFLHDSAGMFLILSVVLINLEILLWSRSRHPKENGSVRLSGDVLLGSVVQMVFGVLAGMMLIAFIGLAIHKRNPEHWSAMVARLAESIEHKDSASAERAMQEVLKRCPDDVGYRLQYARCLLARQKYAEACLVLDAVPDNKRDDSVNILRVLALSGAGRAGESMQLIDEYSPSKMHPAVALAAAGVFARQDKINKCVLCLLRAAESKAFLQNVRRLYPYLASRGQWAAISATDRNQPYEDEKLFVAALKARVMLGNLDDASELLRRNRSLWENKPVFLPILAHIAVQVPADQWRIDFEKCFKASLSEITAEDMISYIEACFCMDRPDLASIGCRQLDKLIPGHPIINLLLVKYTGKLIDYRKKLLADPGWNSIGGIPFAADLSFLTERIPVNLKLSSVEFKQYISSNIKTCISRCNDLIAKGKSTPHLLIIKADALDLDNQPEAALAILDEIGKVGEEGRTLITLRRARMLYAGGRIHEAYEALQKDSLQSLSWTDSVLALKVQILQRLGLDFAAHYEVTTGLKKYPVSLILRGLCAILWDGHGYTDEALFIMKQQRPEESSDLLADLLERTGRGNEAQTMRASLGKSKTLKNPVGLVRFPQAERAVTWIPSTKTNKGKQVSDLPELPGGEKISPFLSGLHAAELAWKKANNSSAGISLQAWENCGRDLQEKATALHRLAVLSAGMNDRVNAIAALDRALVLLPDSSMLWRMKVSLSNGDVNALRLARKALPDDPELWLAGIIVLVRSGCSDDVLFREISEATASVRFPVETLLRAGDYLLRAGRVKPAVAVSRSTLQREKALASVYVLNMSCALADGDEPGALKYAVTAMEYLPAHPDLLKNIARLKMKLAQNDALLVDSLMQLVAQFPGEQEWRERLGTVYFAIGNMEDAFKAFSPVMGGSVSNLQPGICILMAESARQAGRSELAVKILRQAARVYPDNIAILNNLVYSLASSKETVSEAGLLLPQLLGRKDVNASAYDSAAFVSFRLHQSDKANEYLKQALNMLDPGKDKRWYEFALNAAETALSEGLRSDVRQILENIKAAPRPDLIPAARMRRIKDQLE